MNITTLNVVSLDDGRILKKGGASTPAVGGGVPIVNSVDKLNPNSPLGSLACVVEQGSIKESSFRDLYQPDASMLDPNTDTLTAPELLSSVSSVSVFVPQNADSLVEAGFYLVPRDFSMTSTNMAMVQIVPQQGVMAMTIIGSYSNMQEFILAEYFQDTMSYIIHNDQVEAFNAVLANGMDWCYLGNPEGGFITTEEQFATIDLFVKAVAGIPSKAYVYLKKDNWEELYKKDFEKLKELESTISEKADKITISEYNAIGVAPNVYTTYTISSTYDVFVRLVDFNNTSTYKEYIMEIRCEATPRSVNFDNPDAEGLTTIDIKWSNDIAPAFEVGNTYLVSIVNGYGLYTQFLN